MKFSELGDHYMPESEVFEKYANKQGISLEHEDDWRPWWDVFLLGVNCGEDEEEFGDDEEIDDSEAFGDEV